MPYFLRLFLRVRRVVWLLGVAACTPAEPAPESRPRTPALQLEAPTRLRIATWNIAHLRAKEGTGAVKRTAVDFRRLRRHARELRADVVAVQEVEGPTALARVFDPAVYEFHVSTRRSVQRTAFAVRKGLQVKRHPDYRALDVGSVRYGVDLTVRLAGNVPLRLLAVHLKSSCFSAPLDSVGIACRKLKRQLPLLEAWIDARAAAGTPFAVLGDFNRRFFADGQEDTFWRELDDGQPVGADLSSPTQGTRARCWDGRYPDFIDHLVLGEQVARWYVTGSFRQHLYEPAWADRAEQLSDHCPLSLELAL